MKPSAQDRTIPFHFPADPSDIDVKLLEYDARNLADTLKSELPEGVGFTLFLYDYGEKGRLSYISTGDRDDMLATIGKWLMSELEKRDRQEGKPSPFRAEKRAPKKAKGRRR